MIITLDPRAGSGDLAPLLEDRVTLRVRTLPYGDAAMVGRGPSKAVDVGVEIKRLGDLLQCITDQRFAGHQLPGLVEQYDVRYLVVEGIWRAAQDGGIEEFKHIKWPGGSKDDWFAIKSRHRWSDVHRWLFTVVHQGMFTYVRTFSRAETAQLLIDIAAWWDKPWAKHSALHAFDRPLHTRPDSAMLVKPGWARRIAAELPGIGWHKSADVVARFPTVAAMLEATVEEWQGVPGVGSTLASRIWHQLRSKR